jgi:hypothetical protein
VLMRQIVALLLPCALILAQDSVMKLNIVIVEGEGAVNNIRQRMAREPIVQVEDENHKPVAGAIITFTLPNQGAGGVFADGSHSLTMTTDNSGRAVARGIKLNKVNGKFEIRVNASHNGQTARATISQTSLFAAAPLMSGKTITLLAIAAGIAAGIAIGVTRGGNSPTATTSQPPAVTPPTVIIPGTPTVGGPK